MWEVINCCRDLKAENESGASGRDVEAGCVPGSDFFLYETSRRGEKHVGCGRGDEDEFDLLGRDLCLLDGFECRPGCHVAGVFIFGGDAPFLDARAGGDPIVVRLHDFRQILIR